MMQITLLSGPGDDCGADQKGRCDDCLVPEQLHPGSDHRVSQAGDGEQLHQCDGAAAGLQESELRGLRPHGGILAGAVNGFLPTAGSTGGHSRYEL